MILINIVDYLINIHLMESDKYEMDRIALFNTIMQNQEENDITLIHT